MPAIFEQFVAIIGAEVWIKRYHALLAESTRKTLMRQFITDRHSLELSIGPLVAGTMESGAGAGRARLTEGHYAVVSFIAPVARIYERLSEPGRRRIQGMLRDGLNGHQGLLPLRNEIDTATHLMRQGFDVTFSDIESGRGFDFLARRNGAEIEIECKSITVDFGRKIHRQDMLELSTRLEPVAEDAMRQRGGGQIVRISLPSRLPADTGRLQRIVEATRQAIMAQRPVAGPEPCGVSLGMFDTAGTPFSDEDATEPPQSAMRAFLEKQTGSGNPHMFAVVGPASQAAIVFVVESVAPDDVVPRLMRVLKQVADGQFSTARPGILVVQFLDLDDKDLLELAAHASTDPARASRLQLATNRFFMSPDRAHIHTIIYRSHGVVEWTADTLRERGPAYSFKNPSHPLAADPRYSVFSAKGGPL